jgi:hypothetical protein
MSHIIPQEEINKISDLWIFRDAPAKYDRRFYYGEDEFQFADLRLPAKTTGTSPSSNMPVVVFIHGGYW